jgi:hypothetical protein
VSARDNDDQRIDDLYRGPLGEFTAARNALVKTLRGADASRIRKLVKPSVVAWAVNQVYWQARKIYDQLIKSGERLRKAQIAALEGKKADVRDASEAHRRAIADAVKEAQRLASAAGSQPGPDALMRTFEALSLAPEPPEPPGRLARELQPAGFEALTGVTPTSAPQRSAGPSVPSRSAALSGPRTGDPQMVALQQKREDARKAAEEKRRAAEEKKRDAAIKKAEAAVERAKKQMLAAQEVLKRTRDQSS